MKKIAILGKNSLLGVNLYEKLKDNYLIDMISYNENVNKDKTINEKNFTKILNNNNYDTLINCIGLADIDKCEEDKNLAISLNINFNIILSKFLKFNDRTHLIHFSTDQIYDSSGYNKENETTINNFYSKTKLDGEKVFIDNNATVLRTNFIGKSLHKSKKSLSDWMVINLLNEKKINTFNNIYFNPLTFDQIAKLIRLVIINKKNGIYNIGTKNGLSKADLSIIIAKKLNKEKFVNICKSENFFKIKRSKDMRMNCQKFEKEFQIKMPEIEEYIENIL